MGVGHERDNEGPSVLLDGGEMRVRTAEGGHVSIDDRLADCHDGKIRPVEDGVR